MIVTQMPNGYCFEKNIPDIVLQKSPGETFAIIALLIDGGTVIEEKYMFDADGYIRMRQLDNIVSAYLRPQRTVLANHVRTTGLLKEVQVRVSTDSYTNYNLLVANTSQLDTLLIDMGMETARLSEICTVGDELIAINGIAQSGNTIHIIDDQDDALIMTNPIGGDVEDSTITFRTFAKQTFSFTALKCEADMPTTVTPDNFLLNNFLTRLPREKRTATNENEYLSFLHAADLGEVKIGYKIYYLLADQVAEMDGYLYTFAEVGTSEIKTFNASVAVVRAAANLPTQYIYNYAIWFESAEYAHTSHYFTMIMADVYHRSKKRFVFENSFGVLETFTCTGQSETKKQVELGMANIQNRYRKIAQSFVAETTISSGFISEDEAEWLDDLLLSYNIAIYTPGVSGANEEVALVSADKTDTNTNDLKGFTFVYRRAKNNHLEFTAAARGIFDETFDNTFN